MLKHIPTHLITGALGVGKTTTLIHLLKQRPKHERWAVLINEFGQIGLDQALLSSDDSEITLSEVAGGCVCCVNGAPFQVALTRLLKQAKPTRLFIEPSGLGHQQQLYRQLQEAPWNEVLSLQPTVIIAAAEATLSPATLADAQRSLLEKAKLLLVNKAEQLNASEQVTIKQRFAPLNVLFTTQGQLKLEQLPGIEHTATLANLDNLPNVTTAVVGEVWLDPKQPICSIQAQAEAWSIGWKWHRSQQFDLMRLQLLIQHLPFIRAKVVVHTNAGWLSANATTQQPLHWQSSAWQEDSRIELIFDQAQASDTLTQYLTACLVPPTAKE
ncbi:cobalamin biosynthesis protein CobW [Thiopseudomonas alkaliphila]|uniref:CobW family GTP-binding protein n=1 Tax=Thiopseudomonas alkaliphila TaxID=1697053 RepID=UPI00069F7190|nr:GTP-binding protein [Thiopseudomonas alkaliphila]AKX47521.1 cobalamin biosynthesis protein CobW [Thiopseudomonas alkaliphila]